MRHRWLVWTYSTALTLTVGAGARLACSQVVPLGPTTAPAQFVEPTEEVPLGRAYESLTAGVSFTPPAECRLVNDSNKFLAEWADESRDWSLKLGQMFLEHATPLVTTKSEFGNVIEGVLPQTVASLQSKLAGAKVLRVDVTATPDVGPADPRHPEQRNNVGLISIRYSNQGRRRFSQQAIIRATNGAYYVLTFTTPGSTAPGENPPPDPKEIVAADTFTRMVDSIHLLDRTAIKREQDDRLTHTRNAIVNWTSAKLNKALIREQWLRVRKNGKDVGYHYITEELAGAIPKPLTAKEMEQGLTEHDKRPPGDGVLIGVRSRMIQDTVRTDKTRGPVQTDIATWFYVSADKKHEDFTRVVVTDDRIAKKKGFIQENGISDKRVRLVVERSPEEKEQEKQGRIIIHDPKKDLIQSREEWELTVNVSSTAMLDPVVRKLPPWYISQTFAHLLPRLLPLDKPRGYMFAEYISDTREVMMRYVDVLEPQTVVFNGEPARCVPIRDHIGLEGPVTYHYMSQDGVYIGSENRDQKLVMLPTNPETLQHVWADANLTRPGTPERGTPSSADAGRSTDRATDQR